jgi:hypothetical protein
MTNYQVFSVGRVVVLLALAALFLALATGRARSRALRIVVVGLVVAAAVSYPNFGFFHEHGDRHRHIHLWDTYHYFMGAKYLPELGGGGLYEATYVAGRQLGAFADVTAVRDLATYARRDPRSIDASAVIARFSPPRWAAFKDDLRFFLAHIRQWPLPLNDHGYNDSPPRAWLLHAIVRSVPATSMTLTVLTSLDYVLIVGACVVVASIFGPLPAALAFAFLALNPLARFDFIGGSLLRWDWIAALLVGVAAFARGMGRTAGVFLGYAILARIFPVLFVLPLAVKWVQGRCKGSADPVVGRTLAATAGVVGVVLAGFLVWPDTRALLVDYVPRISRHAQTIAANAVGLTPLIVFNTTTWGMHADGSMYIPEAVARAARPAPWVTALATALCGLAALPLVLRARPLESMMYAAPLVFCAFATSGYYYAFLVLLILLPWSRGQASRMSLIEMGLLTATMAATEVFTLTASDMLTAFNAASIQLALFFLCWLACGYLRVGKETAT